MKIIINKFLILSTLFILTSPELSNAEILDEQSFFNNKVSLKIPTSFTEAPKQLITQRFTDEANRPQIVLTDEDQLCLISMSLTENTGDRKTIIHFYSYIKNQIRQAYPSPQHQFLKTDVIKNRRLGMIEVLLPAQENTKLYNMMAFSYIGNEFFNFNLSCPQSEMTKWQNSAREIVESVRVSR